MSEMEERADRSKAPYEAGRESMAQGDFARAATLFEESAMAFPHFKTLELLGECRLKLGDGWGALIPLAAAVGLGTNAFKATYLLALAFEAAGIYRKALDHANRAVMMNPSFARAVRLREKMIQRTGQESNREPESDTP